jgi:peptidyl-prolyl cis-trans isomerase SurA
LRPVFTIIYLYFELANYWGFVSKEPLCCKLSRMTLYNRHINSTLSESKLKSLQAPPQATKGLEMVHSSHYLFSKSLLQRVVLSLILALSLFNLGLAQQQNPTVVMTLGNRKVSADEFLNYTKKVISDTLSLKDGLKFYTERFVAHKLKVIQAERQGLDTTEAFRNEMTTYRRVLADPYLGDKTILENLIKEAYERSKEEINASHILVAIPVGALPADTLEAYKEALRIRERAEKGEKFDVLAKAYSDDPNAQKDAGALGWFSALKQVYAIETAAYNTSKGNISMPIRTKFGYHLIKIWDRRSSRGKVKIAHILLKTTSSMSAEAQADAKRKIEDIAAQLTKGENYENLARKYSEDPTTKNAGGNLGKYFAVSELIPEFADALSALKKNNEVSAPIKTIYGWHILKLLDRKEILPLADMQSFLKQKIQVEPSRNSISRNALVRKIRKNNNITEYQSVVDEVLTKFYLVREENLLKKYLLTINQKPVYAAEFYTFADRKKLKSPTVEKLREVYNEFVDNSLLSYEEGNLEQKYPEFREELFNYREGILENQIHEKAVLMPSSQDTFKLKRYYQQNVGRYQYPERIKGKLYVADNYEILNQAMNVFSNPPYRLSRPFADILFEKDQADIITKKDQMFNLLAVMVKNQEYVLEVSGNIDPSENDTLSAARVKNIVAYLLRNKISATRIIEKDNGKFKPVSKTNRSLNSRVGFTFFSNAKQDIVKQFNGLRAESLSVQEGFFKKGSNKYLEDTPWVTGQRTFSKNGKYCFLDVEALEPARPKRFDEAVVSVIKDYQTELERNFISKMKGEFPVSINEEELKKIAK